MATINSPSTTRQETNESPWNSPTDAPLQQNNRVLIQKLPLPTNGPDGAPLSYKFHHKFRPQIQDTQTLAEARCRTATSSPAAGDYAAEPAPPMATISKTIFTRIATAARLIPWWDRKTCSRRGCSSWRGRARQ